MKQKLLRIILLLLGTTIWLSSNLFAQDYRTKSKRNSRKKDSILVSNVTITSRTIYGIVKAKKENELLPLANIYQMGTSNATQSDEHGRYSIKIDLNSPNYLVCSYFGFESDTVKIESNSGEILFFLKEKFFTINDIVISVSRKNERKFESPVTVETLSAKQIQLNTSLNLYDRMAMLTSVNVITTSFNFKTINTRGFNSSYNTRFIQRYDNMDLSMPGFNLAVGLLNGPIDLDVERVELIPGANSALYGPNAINGLMNISSKSPFLYPGLSMNLKTGVNHVDGIDHAPGPVTDFSIRYAKIFHPKFAGKITMGYQKANDWQGTDYRDVGDYYLTDNNTKYGYQPGPGNPGYDGVSIGGDEVSTTFDTSFKAPIVNLPFLPKGSLKIARTGYRENDMFEYKPYSFKTDIGLYYKPTRNTELSWTSRFSSGSSTFQIANRAQIKGFFLQQHKIELKAKNYSVRAYTNFEDIGESFDFSLAAINMNRAAKSDNNWFLQYLLAYSGFYNSMAEQLGIDTIQRGSDAAARKFADSDNSNLYQTIYDNFDTTLAQYILGRERFQPGTAAYDSIYKIVRSTSFGNGGAGLSSKSKTWYADFLYDFTPYIKRISLIGGANYRVYTPQTFGTVFADANRQIYSNELGAFLQASKHYLDDRLQLQASARVDFLQRFNTRFSPRVSAVYIAGKKRQHSFRLSSQIGFRSPTLMDQFFEMNIPGVITFGGFKQDAIRYNLLFLPTDGPAVSNAYTMSSVNEFFATGDSSKLVKPLLNDIRPEELRTIEFGWRTFLFNKLETDFNVYYVSFRNLINTEQYIGASNLKDTINAAYLKENRQYTQVFRRAVNSELPLNSFGFSISTNYYLTRNWTLFGNYNYNTLLNANDYSRSFVTGFNTPKNKVNIGFRSLNIYKGIGIGSNLQWVDAYYFKEYSRSGIVSAYYFIDLSLNYALPKQKLLLKLGGTNITNNRYVQALGSPTVGAIFYFSVLYDNLLN
ncbi:MAG: TonB-dependent receptor [Bacteroidia bacterium]|nr:TonB-dependent receptor [Bacteroidia bacterium]MCF8425652.1 TonB-dependent receptor [Bacteroidia bacterium]MCF8446833.1 TonB-dependent receptor [Bacteroidia bacterium]